MNTINIEFKVVKNKKFGDYRIDEYLNGKWNNQYDNNLSEKKAIELKCKLEKYLTDLNGSMVVPKRCDSILNVLNENL